MTSESERSASKEREEREERERERQRTESRERESRETFASEKGRAREKPGSSLARDKKIKPSPTKSTQFILLASVFLSRNSGKEKLLCAAVCVPTLLSACVFVDRRFDASPLAAYLRTRQQAFL